MTADLIGLVRLMHRVTGVLVRLTPRQLADLAEGHLSLTVGDAKEPPMESSVAQLDKPAESQARRASAAGVASVDSASGEYAKIAAVLRGQGSVNDGLAYLNELKINGKRLVKPDLLAVAKELNLTLPPKTLKADAITKIVNHAIGNRKKFEGLRP